MEEVVLRLATRIDQHEARLVAVHERQQLGGIRVDRAALHHLRLGFGLPGELLLQGGLTAQT